MVNWPVPASLQGNLSLDMNDLPSLNHYGQHQSATVHITENSTEHNARFCAWQSGGPDCRSGVAQIVTLQRQAMRASGRWLIESCREYFLLAWGQ